MKRLERMLITLLLSLTVFACSNNDDTPMILESFGHYKSAILNQDGMTAYYYIDSNTKDYYNDIHNKILHSSEYETKNMSLGRKIIVTMARHSIDKETLMGMSGESLFIYAVENGWIGEESVSRLEVNVSNIDNNYAQTHIITQNREAPFGFSFRKEDDVWRIDLTSMLPITESELEKEVNRIGINHSQFIYAMLESTSGQRADSSIWQPIN